jgi:hypothetical protein
MLIAATLISALIAFIRHAPLWQVFVVWVLGTVLVFFIISVIVYAFRSRTNSTPPPLSVEPKKFEVTKFEILPTPTPQLNVNRVYVQVVPRCLTETPVHECQGRLLRVYKKYIGEEDWQALVMNEPLILEWSTRGFSPLTLQPGIDQRLNVCFRDGHPTAKIIPTTDFIPMLWINVPNPTGTFRFEISVTAADCPPVDISVDVTVEGRDWDKPIVKLTQGFTKNLT